MDFDTISFYPHLSRSRYLTKITKWYRCLHADHGSSEEEMVIKLAGLVGLVVLLSACESMYPDEGIPRIRSQRDVDAYNATVVAASDKLVCNREQVLGSNIRQFVCLTVAQRERLRQQGREAAATLADILNRTSGTP
tara:strand:- start:411 stop:821 length:411 start_codon:yes stop_codon:yes gene_type:complete